MLVLTLIIIPSPCTEAHPDLLLLLFLVILTIIIIIITINI